MRAGAGALLRSNELGNPSMMSYTCTHSVRRGTLTFCRVRCKASYNEQR